MEFCEKQNSIFSFKIFQEIIQNSAAIVQRQPLPGGLVIMHDTAPEFYGK